MDDSDKALRERLLVIFEEEGRQHGAELSRLLLALEKDPEGGDAAALIEGAFRAAHSLKGAAGAVSHLEVEALCEAMEGIFSIMKGGCMPQASVFDELIEGVDILDCLLDRLHGPRQDPPDRLHAVIDALTSAALHATPLASEEASASPVVPPAPELDEVASHPVGATSPADAPAAPRPSEERLRVAPRKLEELRRQTEDLLQEKLVAHRQAHDLRGLWAELREEGQRARPDPGRLGDIADRLGQVWQTARRHRSTLMAKSDSLLEDVRELLMVPCASVVEGMPRLVRNLALELGKEADFEVTGGELEIDRHILNELRDPLLHMVRNALDHGIESPEERERAGKARRGRVSVSIRQVPGDRVEWRIEDDGRGIDLERLGRVAGRASGNAPGKDADALADTVFLSAVTTSDRVSGISGRGLGLAIVREKAEKLGGSAWVENRPGSGMRVSLRIPLSLATVRAIIVRVDQNRYALPTADVRRVTRIHRSERRTMANQPVARMGGDTVAILPLAALLGHPLAAGPDDREYEPAVLLEHHGQRLLLTVDAVEQERELLVKGVGAPIRKLPLVIGATTLGSGRIAPILDPGALIASATREKFERSAPAEVDPAAQEEPAAILVVEDSITSRTLLKGILRAAGYHVETAVDGLDAFRKLQQGSFNLIVSDIDMPRLNGISLTERIRSDAQLRALPVILVTSLYSSEDRERGARAGANAYIVKRDFEQSDLLEAVRRLT